MLTLEQYLSPHREKFGHLLGTDLLANAERMVALVNALLGEAKAAGVTIERHPERGDVLSSGWRPAEYNSTVPGAATRSKHISCQAADIYDPDGDLDDWLMSPAGKKVLERLGLWLEHPAATKGWCHVQQIPPNSGRRVFYP